MPRPLSGLFRLVTGAWVALRGAGDRLHCLFFLGWAPLAGVLSALSAAAAFSPVWALPAYALGALGCRAVIRQRGLTVQEEALARTVFGPRFPFGRHIVVTDVCGLGGSCFVCPGLGRQILVNMGRRAFEQPMSCCSLTYQAPGKFLVHELAHAWQIAHGHYFPRLWRRLLAGASAGDAYYRPPPSLTLPWGPLNLEQQATVVDEWFAPGRLGPEGWAGSAGMSTAHPYWSYVRMVVRGETSDTHDDCA